MPINFGGGMIFPSSYGRDQYSPAEEAQMEAEQAASEQAAETLCCSAVPYLDSVDGGRYCPVCDSEVDPATGRKLTDREQLRTTDDQREDR